MYVPCIIPVTVLMLRCISHRRDAQATPVKPPDCTAQTALCKLRRICSRSSSRLSRVSHHILIIHLSPCDTTHYVIHHSIHCSHLSCTQYVLVTVPTCLALWQPCLRSLISIYQSQSAASHQTVYSYSALLGVITTSTDVILAMFHMVISAGEPPRSSKKLHLRHQQNKYQKS